MAGWQRMPLPLPDASEKPATLDGLSSQAEAKRDAVAQVLDRRLRGLQLALLARCPKLLLEVFSHEGPRVKRAQRKRRQTCLRVGCNWRGIFTS